MPRFPMASPLTRMTIVVGWVSLILPSVALSQVVINEILQNPTAVSDSAGEWFEVFNSTASAVDIDGWTFLDNDFDSHLINNGGPLLVPAGGFLVLGNNANTGTNGGVGVAYEYSGVFLGNSADELVLLDVGMSEIDRVEWDGGPTFPDPTGASMSLSDPGLDNNIGGNWCTASTPFGAGDLGTPGAPNDCAPPLVVINEILQNPASVSDGNGEWFEVYNPTSLAVDINGWTIQDNGSDSHVINNGGPLLVPAGAFLVLGRNGDPSTNGGVIVAYQYSDVFLGNSADELVLLDVGMSEIDRVEWDGGPTFPDPTGASMSLSDPGLDNNIGANWCEATTPFGAGDRGTPGAPNNCPLVPTDPFGICGDPATLIHDIQGSGLSSADVGSVREIEGVVVGDFQGPSGLNGFFVQEEDADVDGDTLTSEGIFVSDPANSVPLDLNDLVRVRGTVAEFFGLTEINNVAAVLHCGAAGQVTASTVTLPVATINSFEATEGMSVTFPQELVIAEYFNFDRFGEILLTSERHLTPTAEFDPGPDAIFAAQEFLLDAITLDDGRTSQNPDPAIHPNGNVFDLTNLFRGGDTVQNVTGVMNYAFGLYRIQPTQGANYTNANARTPAPGDVGGSLKVATFNVLNYFTTLDDGVSMCGPAGDQGCRGADDPNEFTRQRDKIIAAMTAIDADVVGLMEIENHPGDVPTADLVAGLDAATAPGTYDYIATGAVGVDVIRQAILYQPVSVTPFGGYETLDNADDPMFDDTLNRPMLVQSFRQNATGAVFTVGVNHLKSKGAPCPGDPDTGDGQGNCNLTRSAAAQAIVDFMATDPTDSGNSDYLVIGDLNSYDKEDPIYALVAAGLKDLVFEFQGEDAYSFVFGGQTGYVDYQLASASLWPHVTGATVWHINADESDLINYDTSFKQPPQDAIYAPDAYRSSDHDPVVVGLFGDEDGDGVPDVVDVCPGTSIPESVPTRRLGTNRWALVDDDHVFDTTLPNGKGPRLSFTTQDSGGCSCEQIIEAQGLGNGHTRFGCSVGAMRDWAELVRSRR